MAAWAFFDQATAPSPERIDPAMDRHGLGSTVSLCLSLSQKDMLISYCGDDVQPSARYSKGSVAPSVLKVRTRLEVVRPIVSRASGSPDTRRHPARPATPDLPALNSVFSKQPHAGDRRLVWDGHEGAGGMIQFMPRDDTRLATGQTSHDRIEVAGHCGRLTCTALASRQAALSGSTTISAGAGWKRSRIWAETAAATPRHPALNEDMGRRCPVPLICRLIRHDAIVA